jgi:hypothetical protein
MEEGRRMGKREEREGDRIHEKEKRRNVKKSYDKTWKLSISQTSSV